VAATPTISVITPTFNRRASLARLLDGLARQTFPADRFEVVVVDDGSTDGTVEELRERVTAFRLCVAEQPHRGPAAARNLGVESARGELLLFLDDDVLPEPDLLEQHASMHQAGQRTVVIGPMLPPVSWRRPAWVRWEEEKLNRQYQAMLEGKYACTARQFYTGNASLARILFVDSGGFDPRFTRAEDVELGYRLRDRGARFVFAPRAKVQHFASRSFVAWQRTPYQYGKYDVIMGRDKRNEALWVAARDFERRNLIGRMLARISVGRPSVVKCTVAGLGAGAQIADRVGASPIASLALSGIFNLLYWQGVCDELGGRGAFRQWLTHSAAALSAHAA
jgi:glycosyltransferase involved in cell wall biosynthesis